jgi:hypothetical protein
MVPEKWVACNRLSDWQFSFILTVASLSYRTCQDARL